jgi:hypothetical protein
MWAGYVVYFYSVQISRRPERLMLEAAISGMDKRLK